MIRLDKFPEAHCMWVFILILNIFHISSLKPTHLSFSLHIKYVSQQLFFRPILRPHHLSGYVSKFVHIIKGARVAFADLSRPQHWMLLYRWFHVYYTSNETFMDFYEFSSNIGNINAKICEKMAFLFILFIKSIQICLIFESCFFLDNMRTNF